MKTSAIIPAYQAESFIGRAIRSALRQKNAGEIEIIVVNDCSPANLKEAVSEFPVIKHIVLYTVREKGNVLMVYSYGIFFWDRIRFKV